MKQHALKSKCGYLLKARADTGFSFNTICFFVKLFGSSEPRVPDRGVSSPFGVLPIPSGQLAQFFMIDLHSITPTRFIVRCSIQEACGMAPELGLRNMRKDVCRFARSLALLDSFEALRHFSGFTHEIVLVAKPTRQ